jgi:hypothetical protein
MVANHILSEIGTPDVELFPKQDRLNGQVTSGNYILAPLFGELVLQGKTVFVDPDTLTPYSNQWEFLSHIERVPESILDEVIEINELEVSEKTPQPKVKLPPAGENVFGLPICAQSMLRNGVSRYQRVSCFRLAVHLKRIGLSCDMAQAVLKLWAKKNRPVDQKRRITEKEIIEQTVYAYSKPYRGYGCRSKAVLPYCSESCQLQKNRKL